MSRNYTKQHILLPFVSKLGSYNNEKKVLLCTRSEIHNIRMQSIQSRGEENSLTECFIERNMNLIFGWPVFKYVLSLFDSLHKTFLQNILIWEEKKKKVFHTDMKTVGKPTKSSWAYGDDVQPSREASDSTDKRMLQSNAVYA